MESDERKQYRLSCPLRKEYVFGKIKRAVCQTQDKNCTSRVKCVRLTRYDEGLV